jgi:hypothetical protein
MPFIKRARKPKRGISRRMLEKELRLNQTVILTGAWIFGQLISFIYYIYLYYYTFLCIFACEFKYKIFYSI